MTYVSLVLIVPTQLSYGSLLLPCHQSGPDTSRDVQSVMSRQKSFVKTFGHERPVFSYSSCSSERDLFILGSYPMSISVLFHTCHLTLVTMTSSFILRPHLTTSPSSCSVSLSVQDTRIDLLKGSLKPLPL